VRITARTTSTAAASRSLVAVAILVLALGPWMVAYAQLLARDYSRCCYIWLLHFLCAFYRASSKQGREPKLADTIRCRMIRIYVLYVQVFAQISTNQIIVE
jgi:hypothetical protein